MRLQVRPCTTGQIRRVNSSGRNAQRWQRQFVRGAGVPERVGQSTSHPWLYLPSVSVRVGSVRKTNSVARSTHVVGFAAVSRQFCNEGPTLHSVSESLRASVHPDRIDLGTCSVQYICKIRIDIYIQILHIIFHIYWTEKVLYHTSRKGSS